MKGKALIPLILGLGMGLLAIKFGMDTLNKARAKPAEVETRMVVRAKEDIAGSMQIAAEMLELAETGDDPLPDDPNFGDMEEILDRVAGKSIPRGAVILASMLAPPGTPPGLPGKIEAGYRAVSVRIDEVTGVAFNVHPGAWVDVIVVMDVVDSGSRSRETIAEVVLEHIQVAAVGLSATGATVGGKNRMARSVTLLIPEAEVPKLHLAATKGTLTLAMRGEHDIESSGPYTARDSEIFSGGKKDASQKEDLAEAKDAKPDMSALFDMLMSSQMQQADSEPAPPFTMTIARGSAIPGVPLAIQRFTYENANSWKILAVSQGLSSPSRMRMRAEPRPVIPANWNPSWGRPPAEDDEEEEGDEYQREDEAEDEDDSNAPKEMPE